MTDKNELTPFPEIDRLTTMLDQCQVDHAQELYKIKQETVDKIDKTEYNNRRKHSAELHNTMSETLSKTIEETKAETRKTLADSLLAPNSNHPEDVRHYRACIDLVADAGEDINKIYALLDKCLKFKDNTLARLLVRAHCGDRAHKTLHAALASVDPIIKQTFDFESRYGAYVSKDKESTTWPGWVSGDQAKNLWIDGVPGRTRDPFLRRGGVANTNHKP
jgi:hypothetical protein